MYLHAGVCVVLLQCFVGIVCGGNSGESRSCRGVGDSGSIEEVFLATSAVVIEQNLFIVVNIAARNNNYFVAIVNAETCIGPSAVVGMTGG